MLFHAHWVLHLKCCFMLTVCYISNVVSCSLDVTSWGLLHASQAVQLKCCYALTGCYILRAFTCSVGVTSQMLLHAHWALHLKGCYMLTVSNTDNWLYGLNTIDWLIVSNGDCFKCCPRREAGDVWCLPRVWNLKAVIWFYFTVSSLVLLSSLTTLSVLSFFCVLVHSSQLFPENSLMFFVKR